MSEITLLVQVSQHRYVLMTNLLLYAKIISIVLTCDCMKRNALIFGNGLLIFLNIVHSVMQTLEEIVRFYENTFKMLPLANDQLLIR